MREDTMSEVSSPIPGRERRCLMNRNCLQPGPKLPSYPQGRGQEKTIPPNSLSLVNRQNDFETSTSLKVSSAACEPGDSVRIPKTINKKKKNHLEKLTYS